MKAKVSKLSLFGFRGATQPVEINFDTTKPVTLVFGENGTGKSTIADALALHKAIQERGATSFKADADEEFEDASGNVYNKKTYLDLQRQGLL